MAEGNKYDNGEDNMNGNKGGFDDNISYSFGKDNGKGPKLRRKRAKSVKF